MLSYIFKRLAVAIPTLLFLVVISFLLMHAAPGGPFTQEKKLSAEVLANLNAKYGLDQPVWRQMLSYIWGIVAHFDFGPSFIYKDRTVNEIIAQGFPVTLYYGMIAFVLAVVVGVSMGVLAAVFHNSWLDYLTVGVTIGAQVLPNFVMAPLLVLVFTYWLGWLPGGGWEGGQWQFVIMPVIAMATAYMASIEKLRGLEHARLRLMQAAGAALKGADDLFDTIDHIGAQRRIVRAGREPGNCAVHIRERSTDPAGIVTQRRFHVAQPTQA